MKKFYKKLSVFFIELFKKFKRQKYTTSEPQIGVGHGQKATHYDSISCLAAQSQLRILEDQITQEKCALYAKGAIRSELAAYENNATARRMKIRKQNNYWMPHQ